MKFDKSKVYTSVNADEVKVGSKGFFADTPSCLEEIVTNENANCFSAVTNILSYHNIYRFCAENSSGDSALFYLVEEPATAPEPEVKEVTAVEWDNKPRIMKVWDFDYAKVKKARVIAVLDEHKDNIKYPVVAIITDKGPGHVMCYKHCAELEPAKEPEAEKEYRPYKDSDEFITDYKRRFCKDCKGIPAIWVKNAADTLKMINNIADDEVFTTTWINYSAFMDTYTYPDGTPCGIEE